MSHRRYRTDANVPSSHMMGLTAGVLCALVAAVPSWADVFFLAGGGTIEGRWLNGDGPPAGHYLIETAAGGKLTVERSLVSQVVPQRPAEAEYEQIAGGCADTVQDQWKLAQWCRRHQLTPQRRVHLRKILELEPDHAPARRALGYQMLDGRWVSRETWLNQEGYRYYQGRWRLPQEIQLLQERQQLESAQLEWRLKLSRWRRQLPKHDTRRGAQMISAVADAAAVPALTDMLAEERFSAVRLLYVAALARIATSSAVDALIETSLRDPEAEVREVCVDHLVKLNAPQSVPKYVQALKSSHNWRVNRAAAGLQELGDHSAIGALIDALVTTHRYVLSEGKGSPDAMTATFSNSGGRAEHRIVYRTQDAGAATTGAQSRRPGGADPADRQ